MIGQVVMAKRKQSDRRAQGARQHLRAPKGSCRVHILDSRSYTKTTWIIGEHVSREQYEEFKDNGGEMYVLIYYEDGKPESRIVLREAWYKTKSALVLQKAGMPSKQRH